MNDEQIRAYLRENGYPEHVVREGRAGLLRRWREFVEQVERGYSLGLEDYRNDLDVRAIIALAGLESDQVRALDQRLKRKLVNTGTRVWESMANAPVWDFGYPENAGEDLLEDLKAENLLPRMDTNEHE
jgi:hypothetical protein